jgi:hypothetical protein
VLTGGSKLLIKQGYTTLCCELNAGLEQFKAMELALQEARTRHSEKRY